MDLRSIDATAEPYRLRLSSLGEPEEPSQVGIVLFTMGFLAGDEMRERDIRDGGALDLRAKNPWRKRAAWCHHRRGLGCEVRHAS